MNVDCWKRRRMKVSFFDRASPHKKEYFASTVVIIFNAMPRIRLGFNSAEKLENVKHSFKSALNSIFSLRKRVSLNQCDQTSL
jgi:hypothetical protein